MGFPALKMGRAQTRSKEMEATWTFQFQWKTFAPAAPYEVSSSFQMTPHFCWQCQNSGSQKGQRGLSDSDVVEEQFVSN